MREPFNPQPIGAAARKPRSPIVVNRVLAHLAGCRGSSDRVAARAVFARGMRVFDEVEQVRCLRLHAQQFASGDRVWGSEKVSIRS